MFNEGRPRSQSLPRLFVPVVLAATALFAPASRAEDPCLAPANAIVAENCLPGNPQSEWDVSGAGDESIQGFATEISVNRGQTVRFKIDTDAASYFIDIYRLGYYQGNGARKVATVSPSVVLPQTQPACLTFAEVGLVDCGNWAESAHWDVPSTAVSGIYIAKLTRAESGGSSHIAFVVRDDAGGADLLFKTSDATWQAYNVYGGNSLYVGTVPGYASGHAPKVSYNRPFSTRSGGGGGGASEDWLFNAEYPMVRFLEANGYDVAYTTDVDADRYETISPNPILSHRIFLSVGHDEYWSAAERTAVETARDAGVHLAFFSGNEIYWKTRWEPSADGSATARRTLVCYKEGTLGENVCGGKCDPLAETWTGLWRDGCAFPAADGCRPENALSGQISWDGTTSTLQIPDTYKNLRFWRNTAVATLAAGASLVLTPGTLGYEWDWQQYAEHYPPGRVRLSTTVYDGKTHHLSLYRAPSGALVFGAGTVQWSWGLDANHDRGNAAPSLAMQQATVNLFADMGAQPASLQTGLGLVAAIASNDTTPPASVIEFPASGASVPGGTPVTITGTATETQGVVAGVDVSVDGGATWQAAAGTASWSYVWIPGVTGSVTLESRAHDDLGNVEAAGGGPAPNVVTVTVTPGSPSSCPCSVFPATTPSLNGVYNDGQGGIELGMRFRASEDGLVTGVRFWKDASMTGTHLGHLWTNAGAQLAEVTFAGETASGWQQASFSAPVAVTAGVTYVVSAYSPNGSYPVTNPFFTTDYPSPTSVPLRGLASGTDGANGIYKYGATGFPTVNYQTSNYWVDVVFDIPGGPDVTPPSVTATRPGNGATGVATNAAITATFSEALDATTVTTATFELHDGSNDLVAASVEYDAPSRTATLTPGTLLASSTTYTARLVGGATDPRIKDLAGNALVSDYLWSFTTAAPDSTPPTVTSTVPASGVGGVAPTATVNAVFSEALSPSTVNGTTFELRDTSNAPVPSTVSYNIYSFTATLTPSAALAAGTYTARLVGGVADPRIKDLAGNALSADTTWPFTVSNFNCPCTIWSPSTVPGTVADPDTAATELGVKFRSSVDGFVTGVRFYKGTTNTGTHVGNLWSSTGTLLATATFTGESESGWQEVSFGTPVAITAGTTYVASYHTSTGHYSQDVSYFLTSAVDSPPLQALRSVANDPNGVYAYSATSVFPTSEFSASNYWVDVVFALTVGPDVTPPTVVSHAPSSGATAVAIGTSVTATFSEAIDPATVSGSTFELRDPSSALVPSTVTYNAGTRTTTLAPTSALAYSTTYTATVKGGAADPRIKDPAGNALAADETWSFTTSDPPPPPPTEGPGGPILVISAASNPFGRYLVEILRAEGLNEFFAMDISQVTASALADYDVVILGEMPLTADQVAMLTDWTNAGGTLVAMRPDAQLAGLLGITPAAGTLSNKYLLVNTTTGPGVGIVGQTIQFHGTADLYTLSGATEVATLYSDATTPTANPAVTTRSVGGNGGRAIAFTYDLARSVVYTRQGNPAWAGQKRDGQIPPIRSDDQFYGNASFDPQPDWVDLNKVAIPQADEQQRLLANAIILGNQHRKPLPRFWYLPKGLKAAIVETGDDHGDAGMRPRFDIYLNESPANCSVEDWECVRGTGYLYVGSTFTDADALFYHNLGFETALHVNTNCANFTRQQYQDFITAQMATFTARFPSIPRPATNRNHCIAWSDWSMTAEVEAENGIRLDTNYYYWPASWVQNRSGMFTGSGIPMRFAKLDGTIIDAYQAATQMPDESGESFPAFSDQLLDRANGPEGYYGVFTTNMHFDQSNHAGSNAIVASAQAHGVPVVSAQQMLTWLDGRNGSSFGNLTWSGNALSFSISTAAGSRNLRAMLPMSSSVGQLTGITQSGSPVAYTTQTIKGIAYAFFAATSGNYVAQYLVDTTPPVISAVVATSHTDGTATITWTTNEASDSRVDYGTTPGPLTLNASDATLVTSHSIVLSGLAPSTTYDYRVTSKDAASNSATEPVATSDPLSFTMPGPVCFQDQTTSDFAGGTTDGGTTVATIADGEVTLRAAAAAEFTVIPPTTEWQSFAWAAGGTATVSGGLLSVDGARFNTEPGNVSYGPGTTVEFVATFRANRHQYVGFGAGDDTTASSGLFNTYPWIMFGTGQAGTQVLARVNLSGTSIDVPLPGSPLGTAHKYRIDWKATSVEFYLDDALAHTETVTVTAPMRVAISDLDPGGLALSVDWIHVTPYATSGSYASRVYDGGGSASWGAMSWTAAVPSGTSLQMLVRQGNTPSPDSSWTAYAAVPSSGTSIGGSSRYIQYRADLATTVPSATPTLQDVHISCNATPDVMPPVISAVTATPLEGGHSATVGWITDELATSSVDYGTSPDALTMNASNASLVGVHALTLTGLAPDTTYYFRVISGDASNNSAVEPIPANPPLSFTTLSAPCAVDGASADFAAGTPGGATYVSETADGEVILHPTEGAEFSGTSLPTGWMTAVYGGSPAVVSGGHVSVDGAYAATTTFYGPGRSVEFVATFDATAAGQHAGFGTDLNAAPWAIFSTRGGGVLEARTNDGAETNTPINGFALGVPHRFRIDWSAARVVYAIDGTTVATHDVAIAASMRPIVSDGPTGGNPLQADWMRMTPYPSAGSFASRVFDSGGASAWGAVHWTSALPAGTGLTILVRAGNTPAPDGSWTDFTAIPSSGSGAGVSGRYLQYRADLETSDAAATPELRDLDVVCATTPDTTPPVITNVVATPAGDGLSASVTWTTDEPATSRVDYGTSPGGLDLNVSSSALVTSHALTLPGLAPGTVYDYRVTSADAFANAATAPVPPSTASFFTPVSCPADRTTADFSAGNPDANTAIAYEGDGEVILKPTIANEFTGTDLPADWTSVAWVSGGTSTVSGGSVAVNGSRLTPASATGYGVGRVIEFVATFGSAQYQNAGFGAGDNSLAGTGMFVDGTQPWAMFGTAGSTTNLYARLNPGGDVDLGTAYLNAPHRYRIEWRAGDAVEFFIDGVSVNNRTASFGAITMRPGISDYAVAAPALQVDWIRMTPYAASGSFTSRVFDGVVPTNWGVATWTADAPAGTSVVVNFRAGNTPTPDATWSPFGPVANGTRQGESSRYLQYRADLATTNAGLTPVLKDVAVACAPGVDVTPPVIADVAAVSAADGQSATITWTTNEPSDSRVDYGTGPGALTSSASSASLVKSHTLTLTGLLAGVTYFYRVGSTDLALHGATFPDPPAAPLSFTTFTPVCAADLTEAHFTLGTPAGTYVSVTTDGEVILPPALGSEFSGTALPAGWTSVLWSNGAAGGSTFSGGKATVDGGRLTPASTTGYASGRVLEFVATFAATSFQHIGFGDGDNSTGSGGMFGASSRSWAMFSTHNQNGPNLWARVNVAGAVTDVSLGTGYLGAPHRYRIEWTATGVAFLIDGIVVRTQTVTIPASMRPGISDANAGGSALQVDWIRMTPYVSPGTFDSRIHDAGSAVSWKGIGWNATLPAGTSATMAVRTGNTPSPDGSWTAFAPIASSGDPVGQVGRYLQYRASLSTTDSSQTPSLLDVSLHCGPPPECAVDLDCNDGNSCTADTCDSGFCSHATRANGAACDDGNGCTQIDMCQSGACVGANPVVCSDGNPCTDDACNPVTGACAFIANDANACSDGDPCTSGDHCVSAACTFAAFSCDVGGHVTYYRDSTDPEGVEDTSTKAMAGITLAMTGRVTGTTTSADPEGDYHFSAGGSVTVAPQAKLGMFQNGISSLDATRIAQSTVETFVLTPRQQIAADVSGNARVTSYDAALVAQLVVQLIPRFPVAVTNQSDWQYVPVSRSYTVTGGVAGADFLGILYGDVTANWGEAAAFRSAASGQAADEDPAGRQWLVAQAAAATGRAPITASKQATIYVVSGPKWLPDGRFEVVLGLRGSDGILAIDLSLASDPSLVREVTVERTGLSAGMALTQNRRDGRHAVSLYGVAPMQGAGPFLKVVYRAAGRPIALPFSVTAEANEGQIPLAIETSRPRRAARR